MLTQDTNLMTEIDEYLALYPPEIRAICEALRALIKEAVPGVQEALYRGWQLIGYRTPAASTNRYFCFIAPYGDRVRLGFEWGVLLADEARLLQDSGTRVRSLYLSSTAVFQRDLLTAYLREAAQVAALSKEEKAALALQREAEAGSSESGMRSGQ
jgi:hypothetical protein